MSHARKDDRLQQGVVCKRTLAQQSHTATHFHIGNLGLCQCPFTDGTYTQGVQVDSLQTRIDKCFVINTRNPAGGIDVDRLQRGTTVEHALGNVAYGIAQSHLTQMGVAKEHKVTEESAVDGCTRQVLATCKCSLADYLY